MKYFKLNSYIVFFFLISVKIAHSADKIAILDFDMLLEKTNYGKKIISDLNILNEQNLNSLKQLESKIKSLKKNNKKVSAVIGVDYSGSPCDWVELRYLANKYSFKLINDNCHAMGSKYKGDRGYAAKYADVVTHSYHAAKNITTGEGGAILTNSKN